MSDKGAKQAEPRHDEVEPMKKQKTKTEISFYPQFQLPARKPSNKNNIKKFT